MEKDISTEERIKQAAKKVFQEKGYGLTRTRDIAEEAGINLASLNYYYRSKDKLFEIVMKESIHELLSFVLTIINDETTTLSEKIDLVIERYMDGLLQNPNLPVFVLSEVQMNPDKFLQFSGMHKTFLQDSCLFRQIREQLDKVQIQTSALHYVTNLVSMVIFPIIGRPILEMLFKMDDDDYVAFIEARKALVSSWIKEMLRLEE